MGQNDQAVTVPVDVLAVMARRCAAFRDPTLRRTYDACVAAFRTKGVAYMAEGNSAAGMFRRGFAGLHAGKWDSASRKTVGYAAFRAGEDCARDEARAAVAELIQAAAVTLAEPWEIDRLRAALAAAQGGAL